MSYLQLLYDDCDAENFEKQDDNVWADSVQDSECVAILDQVESTSGEIRHADELEVQSQFDDVSDLDLLHNVEIIESSLDHLLDLSAPKK